MVEYTGLVDGISLLFNWQIPLVIVLGMVFGLLFGVIPGLTAALGIAVLLPVTFVMPPLTALIFLSSVFTGGLTGGGITAILINTPGSPGAVATTFDGYPMARKGLHNEALGIQIISSVFGGAIGYVILLFFIKPISRFALQFGPSEMLFLTLFVLVVIGAMQGKYFSRSFFAGVLGLMVSTIGTCHVTGGIRGTFGFMELEDGLPITVCIIGIFAIPEMLSLVTRKAIADEITRKGNDLKKVFKGAKMLLKYPRTATQGSLVGFFIGLLPAAGAALGCLVSYAFAKNRAGPHQHFGEGEPVGVVAAETANNASEGGSMCCLMALGIPGSAATAVLLGGFMLHGLVPGPGLFRDNISLVYGVIAGNLAQMILLPLFALIVASYIGRVVKVPSHIVVPVLIVLVSVGVFSFRNLLFDVGILFVFGIIGYFLQKYYFSQVSFMLGLFLGRQIDLEINRFITKFSDDWPAIFDRPITCIFIALTLITLGIQAYHQVKGKRKSI